MLEQQEGEKPQLEVVTDDNTTPATPATPAATPAYEDTLKEVVKTLSDKRLNNQPIHLKEVVRFLNINEDNNRICDWLVHNGVTTKSKFNKAMDQAAREDMLQKKLGFIPEDVLHFVEEFAEREKVTIDPSGSLKRLGPVKVDNVTVDAAVAKTDKKANVIFQAANDTRSSVESFACQLRLLDKGLKLHFGERILADAISTWREKALVKARVDTFLSIYYERGKATGPVGDENWKLLEELCFDNTEMVPGFAIAVLKKFIWQVKRKGQNLTVFNHLMPVLSGTQGDGKSTFIERFTKPLESLTQMVDFNLLTDGKTKDIWNKSILFIDEMGHFTKADVDEVKKTITADYKSIRTMRSNDAEPVKNCATFIGCTNKSLAELVRDATGVRRFAELKYSTERRWEEMEKIDWKMLWCSVDPEGQDPMKAMGMEETLREQQEANRARCSIEVWAELYSKNWTDWSSGSDMHDAFALWEQIAFPRNKTSYNDFCSGLTRLIAEKKVHMEKKRRTEGWRYRSNPLAGV